MEGQLLQLRERAADDGAVQADAADRRPEGRPSVSIDEEVAREMVGQRHVVDVRCLGEARGVVADQARLLQHRVAAADIQETVAEVGRPILMPRTGGGENHLAYHLAALLALHRYAVAQNQPLPRFLFIDQPTQVYFPSEAVYEAIGGSIERTEKDADLEAVRKLFDLLRRFGENDAPGFQIIVIEHANLRDRWFQDALVEAPWTKPPALVPEDWPDGEPAHSDGGPEAR